MSGLEAGMTILQRLAPTAEAEAARGVGEFSKLARVLCASRFNWNEALERAHATHATERVCGILKSAVSGGTIGNLSAIADYIVVAQAFAQSLRQLSVFDAALAG